MHGWRRGGVGRGEKENLNGRLGGVLIQMYGWGRWQKKIKQIMQLK